MTIPNPPGRQVVAPGEVVASDWGNIVWSQSVQRFANMADRDAQFADAPDGAIVYLLNVQAYQRKRLGGWRGEPDIRFGTVVVTTNAAGGGVVYFDWPFQTTAYAINFISGDNGAFQGWVVVIGNQKAVSECGFQAFAAPGAGVEGVIRVDYIAVAYQGQ